MFVSFADASPGVRRAVITDGKTKWIAVAGLLLALASPLSLAADTATLIVAQLDSAAAFCADHFPANRAQYHAFVEGMLSGARHEEIASIRGSRAYEAARRWDRSQLDADKKNAAGLCSVLTALPAH